MQLSIYHINVRICNSFFNWTFKLFIKAFTWAFTMKRDDFGCPFVNFYLLSSDAPRILPYGIYISQLVQFARRCTSILDFILQILVCKLRLNFWHRVTDITSFIKRFGNSVDCTLNYCPFIYTSGFCQNY